jgi:hypothetical protein
LAGHGLPVVLSEAKDLLFAPRASCANDPLAVVPVSAFTESALNGTTFALSCTPYAP